MVRFSERRGWLWGLLLIAFVFIAYAPVFHAGFIWDDESHLTRNPCIVGPLGLKEIWTSTQAVYYPLVLTTFWVLHEFVGLNPLPYHILNVVMHAGSAVLLWRVLRQLGVRGAWLGAVLWALHPVMAQSVAWVTELKNTQSCLFYLLSIYCFLNWEKQSQIIQTRRVEVSLMFGLSLLCFVLATLSKPSVVMLPAVLALCVWWRRRRIQWRDAVALAPFVAISALASAWTIWEQKFHARAVGPDWAQNSPERLIIAGRAIWFYLAKLFWPHPLIFIYPRWQLQPSQFTAYLPLLLGLMGLIALWFLPGKAGRAVFFAGAYYVISLFPVLGFFSIYFFRYSFVSDHFQYNRLAVSELLGRGVAFVRLGLCTVVLLLLGILTWQQTAVYHDLITLYTTTLALNPGCWMAHYNLGIALRDRGETDQAITHYRQAIALRPGYAEAHYNLGRLLAEKGEFNDAVDHYQAALAMTPDDAEAHNNLGATFVQQGRIDDAIAHYQKALAIQPDYADASCNLADALLSKADIDGAIIHYLTCVAALPNQPDAQYNLASALLRKGRIDEAIVHYEKVLELLPENANARVNLGSAFLAKDRLVDAITEYKEALRLAPENVAAQSNLAWLLATSPDPSLRNGPEAVVLAEQARRSSNGKPLILRILAAAYAEADRFSEATDTAREALRAADDQGNSVLSDLLRKEIALYESGHPYHRQSP